MRSLGIAGRFVPVLFALLLGLSAALPITAAAQEAGGEPSDPNHDPQAYAEPGYDPRTDPDHPLKGERDPGAAWNNPGRGVGEPKVSRARGDWDWGELYFDETYSWKLVVTNRCTDPQVVTITVEDLPYIQGLPPKVRVAGESELELSVEVVTPSEPNPPVAPPGGFPPGFSWGWVKPPFIPNPFDPTAPKWHQPNFIPVEGRVKLWHPWKAPCHPKRVIHEATGHIHFRPPPEAEADRGPEKRATPDSCVVWWNTGERPPGLDEERDCTGNMRGLAVAYRERVLGPLVRRNPERWSWLPSTARIRRMTIPELLAFKARVDAMARVRSDGSPNPRDHGGSR